jgi:hypothetical protein
MFSCLSSLTSIPGLKHGYFDSELFWTLSGIPSCLVGKQSWEENRLSILWWKAWVNLQCVPRVVMVEIQGHVRCSEASTAFKKKKKAALHFLEHFWFHSKVEKKVQRFLVFLLFPHEHNCPCYKDPLPEGYICYNWWKHIIFFFFAKIKFNILCLWGIVWTHLSLQLTAQSFSSFFPSFRGTGVWTQGLHTCLADTVPLEPLYQSYIVWDRVSKTLCLDWHQTTIFLISASWVAKITSHRCLARDSFI